MGLDLYGLCSAHCNLRTKSPPGQAWVPCICVPGSLTFCLYEAFMTDKLTWRQLVETDSPAQRLADHWILKWELQCRAECCADPDLRGNIRQSDVQP